MAGIDNHLDRLLPTATDRSRLEREKTATTAKNEAVHAAAVMAIFWLAVAASGTAADLPSAVPTAAADETVVLDNTTLWRQFQVAGASHLRDASSNLVRCTVVYDAEDGSRFPERALAGGMTASMFQNVQYSLNPVQAFWSPLSPTNWAGPAFDDSLWPRVGLPQPTLWNRKDMANAGAIGFGRCNYPYDPVLVVTRASFEIKDPGKVRACTFSMDFWGGAVVYVNGQELTRAYLAADAANPDQVADDYPPEAFWDPNGKLLKHTEEKHADRLALRVRRLREVTIPQKLLRKGINVVAIEVHAAPIQGLDVLAKLINGGGEPVAWPPIGVLNARLTVAPAGAATPNTQRPHGVQVWNCQASQGVGAYDYGNPAEPLRPIKIHAGRNTVFSGRLVVGSDQTIKGLKVSVGDLTQPSGGDKIPSSAIRVRYAEPAAPGKSWLSPGQFDGLLDTIPAEIPVIAVPPPAKWMFYSWPVEGAGYKAGAVAPLWFTVRVPRNARPGLYEGVVTVEAEGLRPTTVPLRVSVSAWTARDPKDFRLQFFPYSLEESLALYYNVPLWSDKHFELIGKSLALGAEINARQVFVNQVVEAGGPGSNPESLVRWIRQPDGRFKHDFTIFDKYLNTVAKAIGKPRPLQLGWAPEPGRATARGAPGVSVFDPQTGKVETMGQPPYTNTAASVAFWKPVFAEIRRKLDARGWADGVIKRDRKDGASMPEYLAYPVKDWKTWEAHKARFDPDTPGRFPANWEEEKRKVRDFQGLVEVSPFPYGLFGGARTMMGAEECLIACALEPELIQDINETLFNLWYKMLERMLGDVRLDAIFFWEDMAGKQGSLISPAMFRQFMTPYYQKLVALGRDHGVEMFSLDSDGNIHELTGLFLEAGINVVYPYEVQAGCDVAAMLRQYPGLGAMGGMDKRAMALDKRAMDKEIERVRGILSIGRYIPFPDHAIPPDVSWENYQYFVWRWKELVYQA